MIMAEPLFTKYAANLREFQEWIATQPRLPQNMGKK